MFCFSNPGGRRCGRLGAQRTPFPGGGDVRGAVGRAASPAHTDLPEHGPATHRDHT